MLAEIFFLKLEAVLRAVQEKAGNTRFVPKAPSIVTGPVGKRCGRFDDRQGRQDSRPTLLKANVRSGHHLPKSPQEH